MSIRRDAQLLRGDECAKTCVSVSVCVCGRMGDLRGERQERFVRCPRHRGDGDERQRGEKHKETNEKHPRDRTRGTLLHLPRTIRCVRSSHRRLVGRVEVAVLGRAVEEIVVESSLRDEHGAHRMRRAVRGRREGREARAVRAQIEVWADRAGPTNTLDRLRSAAVAPKPVVHRTLRHQAPLRRRAWTGR